MVDQRRRIEDYDRVLVVEGYSDLLFFAEILKTMGLDERVFIKELQGKNGLDRKVETLVTPGLLNAKVAIAFIVDADGEPVATRQSLANLLQRVTGQDVTDGNWTVGTPQIGFLVVPGPDQTGEIETLVWRSWTNDPRNATRKRCVESYINCMAENGVSPRSQEKGLISALLAVCNDDDPRLGPGARSKTFDLGRPEFEKLRNFLAGFR